jgi:hypothetical protein
MRYFFVSSDARMVLGDVAADVMPANLMSRVAMVDLTAPVLFEAPVKPTSTIPGAIHAYEAPDWMLSCDDPTNSVYADFVTQVSRYIGRVTIH